MRLTEEQISQLGVGLSQEASASISFPSENHQPLLHHQFRGLRVASVPDGCRLQVWFLAARNQSDVLLPTLTSQCEIFDLCVIVRSLIDGLTENIGGGIG